MEGVKPSCLNICFKRDMGLFNNWRLNFDGTKTSFLVLAAELCTKTFVFSSFLQLACAGTAVFGAQALLSTARKLAVLLRCSEHRHDVNAP